MPYTSKRSARIYAVTTDQGRVRHIDARSSLEAGAEFIRSYPGEGMAEIAEVHQPCKSTPISSPYMFTPSSPRRSRFGARRNTSEPRCDIIERAAALNVASIA